MGWKTFLIWLSIVWTVLTVGHIRADNSTTQPEILSNSTWKTTKSNRQQKLDDLLSQYDSRIPPNYEDEGAGNFSKYGGKSIFFVKYMFISTKVNWICHCALHFLSFAGLILVAQAYIDFSLCCEDFPVEVLVQLHITNIDSISETNMEYEIGVFIRQIWYDDRLTYTPLPRLRSLELDSKFMDKVWVPDLFIANEKAAHFHTVTVPNKLMHIYPDGRILYSVRVSATLKCDMDLRKYPLDTQECSVFMESYAYSTDNLNFNWHPTPVIKDPMLILPQFYLGTFSPLRCDKQYQELNYTCIELRFELMRSLGYYMTQVYLPSILIVILSWVSFWLDKDAVPARISLGLLTVLTMTTQSAGARSSLPKVSYAKGIDVWMAACLIFVFAALIEFAYVNVLSRVQKRYQKEAKEKDQTLINDVQNKPEDNKISQKTVFNMFLPSKDKARTVDRISRFVFPLIFGIFNLIYWLVYIFWMPSREGIY